jgi:ferredoxin-type protein NapH
LNLPRRATQWSAIAILLALPMLSRGSALYEAYGKGARHVGALAGDWAGFLYAAFARLFGSLENPAAMADSFQGGFWSITLFGFTVNDPLAALGHAVAGASVHWPLVAGTAAPLLIAALAGRLFCGWVCPVNTLLEINAALRAWLERRSGRIRLPGGAAPPALRYLVLTAGLLISAVAGFNAFAFILPYAGLARDLHLAVYGGAVGFGILFMAVIAATELVAAPRIWCRSLCPTGLLLELVGRWRVWGIRRTESGECLSGCNACVAVCPVAVTPRDEIDVERCMSCNTCVDICPTQVLEIGLGRPKRTAGAGAVAGLAVLLAPLAFLLPPSGALAHHIKGLPHYGYIENYPQVPTRELRVSAPPYEVTLIAYTLDGIDRGKSGLPDDAMLYVSVTDTRTGKAHRGRVEVTLRPADGGPPVLRGFDQPLEESVYRMRATLPASTYEVEIRIGGADGVTARTRLELGGSDNFWLLASLAVAFAALAAFVIPLLRRRRRQRAAGPGSSHADV